jgi:hypothetical protein
MSLGLLILLRSVVFKPLHPAERRPILGGKQIGHLRKHRHAMDGVSMRPAKIGWSEGTRRAEMLGWPFFWLL